MQSRSEYVTSRSLPNGEREWTLANDSKQLADSILSGNSTPMGRVLNAIYKIETELEKTQPSAAIIFCILRDLCYEGNLFFDAIFRKHGALIKFLNMTVNMGTAVGSQPTIQGVTTLLFECREHPDLLISLLRQFKDILPEAVNATITTQFDGNIYRSTVPTTLLQFALAKKNLELLKELIKRPGINLKEAMISAVKQQSYGYRKLRNPASQCDQFKQDFAFLSEVVTLLQDALTTQGVKLSPAESALVAVFKKDIKEQMEFFKDTESVLADLNFLDKAEAIKDAKLKGDNNFILSTVRDLCFKGDKRVIDLFKQNDGLINTTRIVDSKECNGLSVRETKGETTFLYECRAHLDLLILLLQNFRHCIKPDVINATITAEYIPPFGYISINPSKDPTNLVQLAVRQKNLLLLEELARCRADMEGVLTYAAKLQRENFRYIYDPNKRHYDFSRTNAQTTSEFLTKALPMIEFGESFHSITKRETYFITILKKDLVDQMDFFLGNYEADLDFLAKMKENPPQRQEIGKCLIQTINNGHIASYYFLLEQFKTFEEVGLFADFLDAALKARYASNSGLIKKMDTRLFQHPNLTENTLIQAGDQGNTLEVLVKHYAEAKHKDYIVELRSMIERLLKQGLPPEDRNNKCITELMRKLCWSKQHDENEKQQFKAMLKPFTRKYECGPRACAVVTQTANDAKKFICKLPFILFRKPIAEPTKAVEETKHSSFSLAPVSEMKK